MEYCLDARGLTSTKEGTIEVVPLLRTTLIRRWWLEFRWSSVLLLEEQWRYDIRLFIPGEELESRTFTTDQLQGKFTAVPGGISEGGVPAALPIPIPPVVFYFHHKKVDGLYVTRNLLLTFRVLVEQ